MTSPETADAQPAADPAADPTAADAPAADAPAAGSKRSWWWLAAAVIVGVAATLYFYRGFFFTGFSYLQGDSGDGLLTLFISRHWPLLGSSGLGWNDLGFFYPAPDTLGYSDTFLLNGALELVLKLVGVGSLMWFQLTMIAFTAVGYACAVAFLRIGPQVPWLIAIPAALVAMFSNGLLVASNHPQLLMFQLLPGFALLALLAFRARRRWSRWLLGAAAGLLLGLITYSAFYVGYFALLGIGIVLVVTILLVLLGPLGRSGLTPLWRSGPMILVGFGVSMALFVYTYGPIIAMGRERSVANITKYSLGFKGLFNVGRENLIWGPGFGVDAGSKGFGEAPMAPTPLLLAFALVLLLWGLWRFRVLSSWGHLGTATTVAGLVLWLSPVKVGSIFPWAETLYRIPGGSALRAIGRIEVMASVMLALGIALLLAAWWQRRPRISIPVAAVASVLLLLLVAEQVNLTDRQEVEVAMLTDLQALPAPPAACRSFVLTATMTGTLKRRDMFTAASQASFVSQEFSIPTWNGYSGLVPDGWNLRIVNGPTYRASALKWGRTRNLLASGCGLDLGARSWLTPTQLAAYLTK